MYRHICLMSDTQNSVAHCRKLAQGSDRLGFPRLLADTPSSFVTTILGANSEKNCFVLFTAAGFAVTA